MPLGLEPDRRTEILKEREGVITELSEMHLLHSVDSGILCSAGPHSFDHKHPNFLKRSELQVRLFTICYMLDEEWTR